jgi:hypothetical protein
VEHVGVPTTWSVLQTWTVLQFPQAVGSLIQVSQPSSGSGRLIALQSRYPVLQTGTQAPLEQAVDDALISEHR